MAKNLQIDDRLKLRNLAEFRYELRQFLQFSEGCASEAGLHTQQHQLLLQLAGAPDERKQQCRMPRSGWACGTIPWSN